MTEGLNLYVFYFYCIFFSIIGRLLSDVSTFSEHRLAYNGLALNIIRLLSNINLACGFF